MYYPNWAYIVNVSFQTGLRVFSFTCVMWIDASSRTSLIVLLDFFLDTLTFFVFSSSFSSVINPNMQ